MSDLVDRPNLGRGARRREQLVEAGVALLAEGGWPAVTSRGVAERAGANLGLIHYHFGGLLALHAAIARRAGELVINPVIAELLGAPDERAALRAVHRMLPATTEDDRITMLATELVAGARRAPELGEVLREQLRQARTELAGWLRRRHPEWPAARRTGAATLLAALLDGLMLHRMLDSALPVEDALATLDELVADGRKERN
ncbi:TetR/AcrR family transcriptional regulator [Amycolatopsis cihanbeyliensis]|uniref:TetR family transcriptional regulator n=1 Tax=Amycolatopsis cihanbeyliensis TaxID=1128664 RepID=A0A542DRS7_AMYCI|nr:TetR family transcriptional regulator C-terminal domain-containing protein [Amycolatopsis cihanbeyliensis]TQJ05807.1 TetR family transcriptional regulator [Amycolatopsis cihanbeyliensis]